MTDTELDALEAAAKAATPGPWGYDEADEDMAALGAESQLVKDAAYIAAANPNTVLSLLAELRQARKERDWLAEHRPARYCPTVEKWETCLVDVPGHKLPKACKQCWIDRAKEAVSCQKN